jgi:ComF family protein
MDLLLPPACAGCGRSAGMLVCDVCRSRMRAPSGERDRFVVPDAGRIVGERLRLAMAAYAYDGPMRRALAALKYGGASRVAPVLARLAVPTLARLRAITGEATLVPVPVHAERLAARGYDQAALLARALGRHAGLPVMPALARVRATTEQHRLDRGARLRNLRGAFAISGPAPPIAILVDDIITTTATLEACAGVLHDAGCEAVYGLAIAREV